MRLRSTMRSRRLGWAAATVLLAVGGAAQASAPKPVPSALARMTPEDVAARVEVRDDPLEEHIRFSTKPVHRRGSAADGVAVNDGYVTALRSREGGEVRWRVNHELSYLGARRDLRVVHLRTAQGLEKIPPSAVRRWDDGCPEPSTLCLQHVRVEFEAPERVIREIAAAWKPGGREAWPLRFKDAYGQDVTVGLAPAEVAGLVQAVDAWRR